MDPSLSSQLLGCLRLISSSYSALFSSVKAQHLPTWACYHAVEWRNQLNDPAGLTTQDGNDVKPDVRTEYFEREIRQFECRPEGQSQS